jgi:hypothetical protein
MKRILLRTVPDDKWIPGTEEYRANTLSYDDAIRQIIRKPTDPQKGADLEEIRHGVRILDALDAAKDNVVELEDADWNHLKDKTLSMQWAFVDKRILDLVEAVTEATDTVPLNHTMAGERDGQMTGAAAF